MAFIQSGWARVMSSGNEKANVWYSYKTTADTIATIKGSGYFNSLIEDLTNGVGAISVGDVIHAQGSDDYALIRVTAVTTAVTTAAYSISDIEPDTIVNADINSAAGIVPSKFAVTTGSIIIGAASIGAELDVSTDTGIMVGNGSTATIVTVSGDATLANTGALTIADSILNGSNVSNVADANVIGGIPVIHRITTAGGATANTDVTLTHKTRILDCWIVNRGAGTASDTVQILNSTNAISDAVDISGADNTIARISTIDDAYEEIAASGTLRVTETDGGSSDSPSVDVYVLCVRVA